MAQPAHTSRRFSASAHGAPASPPRPARPAGVLSNLHPHQTPPVTAQAPPQRPQPFLLWVNSLLPHRWAHPSLPSLTPVRPLSQPRALAHFLPQQAQQAGLAPLGSSPNPPVPAPSPACLPPSAKLLTLPCAPPGARCGADAHPGPTRGGVPKALCRSHASHLPARLCQGDGRVGKSSSPPPTRPPPAGEKADEGCNFYDHVSPHWSPTGKAQPARYPSPSQPLFAPAGGGGRGCILRPLLSYLSYTVATDPKSSLFQCEWHLSPPTPPTPR